MRALITIAFVLFLVVSVPLLAWLVPVGGFFLLPLWWVLSLPFVGALCVVWLKDERPQFLPSDIYYPPSSRRYKSWNSIYGWPRASNLFYECCHCLNTLPSETNDPRECSCGNLFITPNYIGAQNPAMVRLYEE
ncbi:hypothetical protein IAD21_04735 [Abditibacteriota bacterium]|nr:hypothetical protein IAD21_04735 [Abditibacteriota bacterium]